MFMKDNHYNNTAQLIFIRVCVLYNTICSLIFQLDTVYSKFAQFYSILFIQFVIGKIYYFR